MQEQKHKTASGNQNHGVWVCNKCGWTYPNPHPSAKHRRNHKRHCGKLGDSVTTGSPKQDRPSSPDSEEDLLVERRGSAVKQHAALKDEVSDKGLHGLSIAENAGAEAGDASSRFEEEVFADAATEFSVSLPSPNCRFIQLFDSDLSDAESDSAEEILRRGYESVAIGTGEGKTEQKPVILSDPVESSRRQSSHESFETKRREDFIGFTVHSNNGDAESDHRSNGITCILEPNLSKSEAFVPSDNADAGIDDINTNIQEDAMETQNHQLLEAEAELSQGKTLSRYHALFVETYALEVKRENTPLLSLSEAPKMQAEHYSSGHLEGLSDETCEKIKGHKKGEVRIESYQNFQSKMNVNKNPSCHGYEWNSMLYVLDASAGSKASLKENVVHSKSPSPKTCSDTIGEFITESCSPTSSSATDESHATGSFSAVRRSVDKSVPVEPEIEKTGLESGKSDGANGYQHHGSKDQDLSSPLMSTEESLGNITSSEILNPKIEESVKKAECNENISRENSVSRDKDVLTPFEALNHGKYLEASDVHEDLNLEKQKASLSLTGTGTPVQADGYTQSAVPYLNGTHIESSPCEETEDPIPQLEVKDGDSSDKYGSIVLQLQSSSVHRVVTMQSESVFTGDNTHMEHDEHLPPAAQPKDSDFHVQEKLHKESKSNQNCLNGMPMQADMEVSGIVLDNSKYKKSTSDSLKIELLQSEENLVASSDYLKTRTVEKTDSLTTTDRTTEQANSAVEDDTLLTSEHGSQEEGKRGKRKGSCDDNSKLSAVREPHENVSDTDIFAQHSLVMLVEPSRDCTRRTTLSDSTAEQVLQTRTTSISDYAGSHSPSTLVNDSEGRANDEIVDKAMSLEKARTPLKRLLVESKEENTDTKCHKRTTVGHPKSSSTTTENLSEVKTLELASYKVYQSQSKGNPTPTYAAKIRLNSPAWILGNKREKQKTRGVYSWIACVCCSSMN